MQLLNFPHLVQKQILLHMTYGELFLLSLISKKSTRIVQRVGWYKFGTIEYYSHDTNIEIRHCTKDADHLMMRFEKRPEYHQELKQLNFNGLDATFRFSTNFGLKIFYEESSDDPIIRTIYNQLNALFGKHANYKLISNNSDFLPTYIPSKHSELILFKYDAEVVDFYYSEMSKQEYVRLAYPSVLQQLSPHSKIYSSETLEVGNADLDVTEHLLNFEGHKMLLKDALYVDFVRLMERWTSGESFQNLECFEVEKASVCVIDVPLVTRQLNVKRFPSFIKHVDIGSIKRGDFITSNYIVRDDGIVGYVLITLKTFILSVMDFNEEQMLERLALPSDRAIGK